LLTIRSNDLPRPVLPPSAEIRAADEERAVCRDTWFDDDVVVGPDPLAERYRLLGVIGCGGFGAVFCAYDLLLDEHVAVKCLRSELLESRAARDKLVREARLARRVSHPNVVRVHDVVCVGSGRDAQVYVTMEHVPGVSLGQRIDEQGPLPWPEAASAVAALADGLAAVHAAGVLHCDVKSDNVIVAPDGRVVLADFSVARFVGEGGRREGTPEYMAPEQWSGAELDERTDVYGLGMVLLEALIGRRDGPCDPRRYRRVPDLLAGVVLRCLAPHPDHRFGSAEEVAAALRRVRPAARRKRSWWSRLAA
jgi:eukaryotic-like serine/threonine-protein kinase